LILLGILGLITLIECERKTAALRSSHSAKVLALQTDWAREDSKRKAADHQEALKRKREYEKALSDLVGGPSEAAAHDPDLSIQQMLEQTAVACAPAGVRVKVRVEVDGFTEFEAVITLMQPATQDQLAEMTACLMRHGAPYVHTIRFIRDSHLLVELDRRTIETVSDWSQLSPARKQELFLTSDVPASAESPTTGRRREGSHHFLNR